MPRTYYWTHRQNNELVFGIATCVWGSNDVKWNIFNFNVVNKVLLSVYKGEIMQHCSGHNNDKGIRQVPNIIKFALVISRIVVFACQ